MNYKALLDRTESLTQRKGKVDKIQDYILDNYLNMVVYVAFLLVILGIETIKSGKDSVIISSIFYLSLLVIFFWYARNKYRKMEDDMKYLLWDFYSVDTRRNILEEEIDFLSPEVLTGEVADYNTPITFVSIGDLSYKIIPTSTNHYKVMLNEKELVKFESIEEATSFIADRIRKSIKVRLGL